MAYINGRKTSTFFMNGVPATFILKIPEVLTVVLGRAVLNRDKLA